MNKQTKKDCSKYIRAIRKELCCSFNVKNVFLYDIKNKIKELADVNPNLTFDDITSELGMPNEIADSFHQCNIDELKKRATSLLIYEICLIILLILAILFICLILENLGGTINITIRKGNKI